MPRLRPPCAPPLRQVDGQAEIDQAEMQRIALARVDEDVVRVDIAVEGQGRDVAHDRRELCNQLARDAAGLAEAFRAAGRCGRLGMPLSVGLQMGVQGHAPDPRHRETHAPTVLGQLVGDCADELGDAANRAGRRTYPQALEQVGLKLSRLEVLRRIAQDLFERDLPVATAAGVGICRALQQLGDPHSAEAAGAERSDHLATLAKAEAQLNARRELLLRLPGGNLSSDDGRRHGLLQLSQVGALAVDQEVSPTRGREDHAIVLRTHDTAVVQALDSAVDRINLIWRQ
mmetsp:Transcript_109051/g.314104  ORF Transcript_109051/g.314104 Transcript_109051/m.314104 type:complete len:287 (+) Transcript_109051:551-1411(+)